MEVAAFLDESYDSFFDLSRDDGYFCMGVFIVPASELEVFEKLFLQYRQQLSAVKGARDDGSIASELKSKHLRTIDPQIRRQAIAPLLAWAAECGAAVGGFYTSTEGYLKYSLRSDRARDEQMDSGLKDPEAIEQARKDIQNRRRTEHAESLMIGDIAQMLAGMLLHYCAYRGLKFSIRYDPREAEEDRQVFQRIDALIRPLETVLPMGSDVFLGCRNDEDSHTSCGIQMVDHITRDLRQLFHQNPRLLTDGTTSELITPSVTNPENTMVTTIGNKQYKWGESFPMKADLVRELFATSSRFTLADYHQILMKKRVSCFSASGEARIINLQEFEFENMVD